MSTALANGTSPSDGSFDLEVGDAGYGYGPMTSHPPDGAAGGFSDELPFIVISRRTLPWERAGFGQIGVPWLTAVLTRDEAPAEATLDGTGVLRCLDVAMQTRLLARQDEVRLLAHVRETNPSDTATSSNDADGWQAVVVTNRLPRFAGRWRLTLVSLDGRTDLLGANPTLGLNALYSTTFRVSNAAGSFGDRLAAMEPVRFADPARLSDVDAAGAVALNSTDRSGRAKQVHYRSPLTAGLAVISTGAVEDDITYSAAFELGRLLSAADQRMLRELTQWRRAILHGHAAAATARVEATGREEPLQHRAVAAALLRWQPGTLPRAGAHGAPAAPGTVQRPATRHGGR